MCMVSYVGDCLNNKIKVINVLQYVLFYRTRGADSAYILYIIIFLYSVSYILCAQNLSSI